MSIKYPAATPLKVDKTRVKPMPEANPSLLQLKSLIRSYHIRKTLKIQFKEEFHYLYKLFCLNTRQTMYNPEKYRKYR